MVFEEEGRAGQGGWGRTSRVEGIDIDAEVHRLLSAHTVPNLLNNPLHPNRINLPGLHNLKPTIPIIIIITHPTQRRANPGMNIRIIG